MNTNKPNSKVHIFNVNRYDHKIKIIANHAKKLVIAILTDSETGITVKSKAVCIEGDEYVAKNGIKLAVHRVLISYYAENQAQCTKWAKICETRKKDFQKKVEDQMTVLYGSPQIKK